MWPDSRNAESQVRGAQNAPSRALARRERGVIARRCVRCVSSESEKMPGRSPRVGACVPAPERHERSPSVKRACSRVSAVLRARRTGQRVAQWASAAWAIRPRRAASRAHISSTRARLIRRSELQTLRSGLARLPARGSRAARRVWRTLRIETARAAVGPAIAALQVR